MKLNIQWKKVLYGITLIVIGIILAALHFIVGGNGISNFISSIIAVISVLVILAGTYMTSSGIKNCKWKSLEKEDIMIGWCKYNYKHLCGGKFVKIISLVENTTRSELKAKHGLSLYIETKKHKILFDLGPDKTLFENAVKRNIDISKVDTVIISHGKDQFRHEQNLVIFENQTALIMGCGHAGVINIMEEAKKYSPDLCVGGYHLFNPLTKKTVSTELLKDIATELQKYKDTEFYTCHCTGKKAFDFLSHQMSNMHYISCGESVEI